MIEVELSPAGVVGLGEIADRLSELIEQETKASKRDLSVIVRNKRISEPEFRELFMEVLGGTAGEPERALERLRGEPQQGAVWWTPKH